MEERMERQEEMEIDLGTLLWNFLKGLTRFWWLVILLALIGSAVLYVKNSRFYTPMYRSEASFTVLSCLYLTSFQKVSAVMRFSICL